jgi:hypothetical protein
MIGFQRPGDVPIELMHPATNLGNALGKPCPI